MTVSSNPPCIGDFEDYTERLFRLSRNNAGVCKKKLLIRGQWSVGMAFRVNGNA